jgi:enterochelin esterase-like enzyme
MEPIRGDPTRTWVTYLWHGDAHTRSVSVVAPQTNFGTLDPLTRLAGTHVWYRTFRVLNGCMGVYKFILNAPPLLSYDIDGMFDQVKRGKFDPLNPTRYVSPSDPDYPDHPLYGHTFSVLHLPGAPDHPEAVARPHRPAGTVREYHLRSRWLKNRRRIWVYTPPVPARRSDDANLVIFSDGYAYAHEIAAPTILDHLQASGRIPPTYALFVDALDFFTRDRELQCNPDYGKFLVQELLPWSRRVLRRKFDARHTTLAGLSLGGLSAMNWAMRYPNRFGGVISQSGSIMWAPEGDAEPNALAREFIRRPRLPLRIYLDAGRYEGGSDPENGEGHLGANRHLRDILRLKGYPVRYQTYNGNHQFYCWRQTLVDATRWILGS